MADIKARAFTTSKKYGSNDQIIDLTATKDGALYNMGYILNKAIEGRLFTAILGTLTTPVTFRVGLTALQPELAITVPTGRAIIPVRILCGLEASAGTVTEITASTAANSIGAGTSTSGTILCTRTDAPYASACGFYYTYSGNATATVNELEFWRANSPYAGAAGTQCNFDWSIETGTPQVLVGPASLIVHIDGTGTAPTGYAKVSWAEFLTSEL